MESNTSNLNGDAVELFSASHYRHPYYVVSPPYLRTSAGIRVLHMLCAALNRLGARAYMLVYPNLRIASTAIRDYSLPYLTAAQVRDDYAAGISPITIYPETIGSNIFESPVSYEYLLNFKKALGQGEAESKMMMLAYSDVIRRLTPGCDQTLFIPTSDSDFFSPLNSQERTDTAYFYAAKYQLLTGTTPALPEPAIEIKRDGPDAPDRLALREIYRRAKRIYVFENSAVANEAALCGCPVVLMRSSFFQNNITEVELGMRGMTWETDAESLAAAQRNVAGFRRDYMDSYKTSAQQLQGFIGSSQARAAARPYASPMNLPFLLWRRRWEMVVDGAFRVYNRIRR